MNNSYMFEGGIDEMEYKISNEMNQKISDEMNQKISDEMEYKISDEMKQKISDEMKGLESKIEHWIQIGKNSFGDERLSAGIYLRFYSKQYRVLTGKYFKVRK